MNWSELHGNETIYGKRIGSVDKLGGMHGLPDQAVLNQLLDKAQRLDLEKVYTGMSFSWGRGVVANSKVTFHNEDKRKDTSNKSSAICYEDRAFPIEPGDGHLVIRQSLAPCARCRAAFRAWSKQRQSSIIVSADKGYDNAADNTVFIFAPTGAAYQWA